MTNVKANKPTSSDAAITAAIGADHLVDAMNVTPGETAASAERQFSYQPLTGATITKGIEDGLIGLSAAFEEFEQRIVGSNGKAYPLDATLPDGCEDTGDITIVNRFAFIQDRVLESVVDAIAWQHEAAEKRLADDIKALQGARRIIDSGRSSMTEADLDRKLVFVEAKEEQVALLACALKAAMQSYELAMGHAYATRAERKALADARRAAVAPAPSAERTARLNRFA